MTSAHEEKIVFGTKRETLSRLRGRLRTAAVLPMDHFSVEAWNADKELILSRLEKDGWFEKTLVVRSSATDEDGAGQSLAGHYKSVLGVKGRQETEQAIEAVIRSFDRQSGGNEIFVQSQQGDVAAAGVVFTCDPKTGLPYFIFNYDDVSGLTDTVTSGTTNAVKSYIHHRNAPRPQGFLGSVLGLAEELESLFGGAPLDFEFAALKNGDLCLFQVRPLLAGRSGISDERQVRAIERIEAKIASAIGPHPYLHGKRTLYGVMPDWNPAEIIGIRPGQLALSLYREVITDAIWAYQRDNYGYQNLRSFPLLVDFEGLPYIDVRVSFNSFLPKDLPPALAEKLVDYYVGQLLLSPSLHDKVEFEIIFSAYALDLRSRLAALDAHGFDAREQQTIFDALLALSNRIICSEDALWRTDLKKLEELERRRAQLDASRLDPVARMYWLLEDCKRYGTLPFAGLARAGFIAVQFLRSFVAAGIISQQDHLAFLSTLETTSSCMECDFRRLPKDAFLKKYGHLRPGTYDILSARYDETPDNYFDWTASHSANTTEKAAFSLAPEQLRAIEQRIQNDGLDLDAVGLLSFIKAAIEAREHAKFVFTRNISDFLSSVKEFGAEHGLSQEDCAHLNVHTLMGFYSRSADITSELRADVARGRAQHELTKSIILPPVITNASQVWAFEMPVSFPNFITHKDATGGVVFCDGDKASLRGAILMIPSADPGYDWIFSHGIAGFITAYGGSNSHMAIRAAELAVPAVIGAGESLFGRWAAAKKLRIDCLNHQVHVLQ